MRDYHRKSCQLSRGIYFQVKGILMDYDRLRKERTDILYGTKYGSSGMPHGSSAGDPVAQKAIRLGCINERLEAVDQAAVLMRGERGEQVGADFDPIKAYWSYDYFNLQHRRTAHSPEGPCRRTWNNFKDRFSEAIAKRLKLF